MDEEPEWRITAEAAYVATYLFYGRVPPGDEAAAWGRGRRPEEDQAGPGVWVEVVVILCVVGTYLLGTMPADYFAAVTQRTTTGSTAVALLPTCLPIAHGPPMCYEWERPSAMAPPPPASGSGDSDWSDNDDEKVAMDGMECFYGLVRDATRSCSYGWERPAMAPRGRESDWSGNDDKAAMECFYGLVRDAAKNCFGWSHDTVRSDGHIMMIRLQRARELRVS